MSNWKDTLVSGVQQLPPRICVYGPGGIGKSTFASQFPSPIYISTEDGLASLDVTSFPKAKHVNDVSNSIKTLIKEDHEFKTLVVDSVDWLEALIINDVEATHDAKDLAFGKGQVMVAESFREILQGMDVLRRKKDMNIVLVAHSAIVRFDSPITEPYDRYTCKLTTRNNALLQEWVDLLAFVNYKVLVKRADVGFNTTKSRGITTGERLLHMVETPAYVAKNRYALPEEIELNYKEFAKLVPIVGE